LSPLFRTPYDSAQSPPSFPTRRSSDLPTRDERQLQPLLHEPVLQNAEAGQCRAIPGVAGVIEFDSVEALRNAGQDFLRRLVRQRDRKSTRLNSSHGRISYAVFGLKKKN